MTVAMDLPGLGVSTGTLVPISLAKAAHVVADTIGDAHALIAHSACAGRRRRDQAPSQSSKFNCQTAPASS